LARLQVVDVSTSKTGKHGHAKCHFVALDIFTSRKMEELVPSSHNLEVRCSPWHARWGAPAGRVTGRAAPACARAAAAAQLPCRALAAPPRAVMSL
jgi:hypothetical protein